MSDSSVGQYLKKIGRYPLLTPVEEIELDQLARDYPRNTTLLNPQNND